MRNRKNYNKLKRKKNFFLYKVFILRNFRLHHQLLREFQRPEGQTRDRDNNDESMHTAACTNWFAYEENKSVGVIVRCPFRQLKIADDKNGSPNERRVQSVRKRIFANAQHHRDGDYLNVYFHVIIESTEIVQQYSD